MNTITVFFLLYIMAVLYPQFVEGSKDLFKDIIWLLLRPVWLVVLIIHWLKKLRK